MACVHCSSSFEIEKWNFTRRMQTSGAVHTAKRPSGVMLNAARPISFVEESYKIIIIKKKRWQIWLEYYKYKHNLWSFFLHAQAGAERQCISNPELQDHGADAAPAETASGAERRFPPAAHAGQNVRPVLPVGNAMPPRPRRLHVLHPSAAQVRESVGISILRPLCLYCIRPRRKSQDRLKTVK